MKRTLHIVRWQRLRRRRKRRITPLGVALRLAAGGIGCAFTTLFLIVALGVGTVAGVYAYFARDLPEPEEIQVVEEDFETTKIYDRTGKVLLYEVIDPRAGDRSWVPLSEISPYLQCVTIALEDKTFYENPGFDPEGIARAFVSNLRGLPIQGGSSITQQLIKNVLIPPEERVKRSYARKIKELILATEITRRYSKDQILEWYLNTNFYGNLAYGIEAAARIYFGKSAAELTPAEAAMLAPIPQSPAITPLSNDPAIRALAKKRQELALDRMAEQGCITREEAEAAKKEKLQYRKLEQRFDIIAPHFSTYVVRLLSEQLGLDPDQIYRGGLKVYTTLDLDLQAQAECVARAQVRRLSGEDPEVVQQEAIANGCEAARYLYPLPARDVGKDHHVSNAAVVVLRPSTGETLAMVGSLDYWDETIDGKFNVAVDGQRQPGSSFKPFTYVTLLSQGYSAATLFWDVRQAFDQPGRPPYTPENYDRKYHGPQRLRLALARSYNVPAVIAMDWAGIDNVLRTAHRMGINGLDKGLDYYGLSLTLGGGEVSLLDMVYAFSVFANGGKMVGVPVPEAQRRPGYRELNPVAILRVEDRDGKVLWQYDESQRQQRDILSPQLAYIMNSILSDRQARCAAFGCPNALELDNNRPAAAKTGTTNDYVDAWTIGYTPQLAAGVWVGNTDNSPMEHVPGSKGAAPIWKAIMEYALADEPIVDFPRPEGLVEKQVCAVSGLLPTPHCPTVTEIFIPGTEPTTYDTIHQVFRINRETGKLATVYTPPELVEEKVFEVYPPEALDWAIENERPLPPTEWDTVYGPNPHAAEVAILEPQPYSYISGAVVIVGNARGGDFNFYRLAYGAGLNPDAWIQIGTDHGNQVDNGPLEFWDVSQIEEGLYSLQLTVVNHDGSFRQHTIQVTVDNTPPELELTYPPDGAEYIFGDDEWVNVNVEVQDNISVDRVEFYIDDELFSTRRVAPFNDRWIIKSAGPHTIHVIAYDAAGNKTESPKVKIFVRSKK